MTLSSSRPTKWLSACAFTQGPSCAASAQWTTRIRSASLRSGSVGSGASRAANSRNGSLAPARPVARPDGSDGCSSAGRADHFSRKGGDLNARKEEGCQEDREEEGEEEVALAS